MLGDSQVRRFANYLRNKQNPSLSILRTIAVSGMTIRQLKVKLKADRPILDSNIPTVIFIGTNDFLNATPLDIIKQNFLSLLRYFERVHKPNRICIVEIPHFPRFKYNTDVLHKIALFNKYLATLKTDIVKILRWNIELSSQELYFEKYIGVSKRPDRVHLNKVGFSELTKMINNEVVFSLE